MSKKMRALITGGAGFIGSQVARHFLRAGYGVYLYDSFVIYSVPDPASVQPNFAFRLKDIFPSIHLIRGSTLHKDFLRRTLTEIAPDVIVHMAAMPLPAIAIDYTEEAFQSILNSTLNILEIMRDAQTQARLVYISSSMVYGDFQTPEADEDEHPKNPKDIYGAFKLAGEVVVSTYGRNYGIDFVTCRPSAVYGPTDTNQRVIQKFIQAALHDKPLVLDGDGSMQLDFTYVEDTALAIYLAATTPAASGKVYNVTRGESRSLKDLIEIIRKHVPHTTVVHREAPKYMPVRGSLSIARARRDLGYEPRVSLEEGVRLYVEHLRNNPY
ncbi:NAD-dependent epimerase/dehydratase family protein [Nordella sp. HKS 07]|uniref:NAD-dependent epimerase/dehydratase family protein n=1 Tax=Nordella sp. HKS 07 TaxID=2712222 RepID=UPI0013E1C347|nr:NAD-dependent epimerase/dehydratase family protein [Nordella sp. HKS 07]QIG48362.1 NAD-dependent epimerase/dehydratase family protein [Nordella sp. HKS 07]